MLLQELIKHLQDLPKEMLDKPIIVWDYDKDRTYDVVDIIEGHDENLTILDITFRK